MRLFLIASAAVGIGSIALTISSHTYAATPSAAEGLQLSPVVVNLDADPGKTYTINIKVTDVTDSSLAFSTAIDDFGAKGETGTPSIILDANGSSPTSIQEWVGALPNFTLTAHAQQNVTVTVNVPTNAEAGGHYGVIRFTGTPVGANTATVGQIASAGTLVLVRVSGDVKEDLQLSTFTTATEADQDTSFFENGPFRFVERFTNSGNVHVQPVGQIEVRDSFGNHVTTIPVNSDQGNVLPGSVRRFEENFSQVWLFGRYTATISIAYGTQGEAIVRSISFWVIPYKLILVGLLVLATLVYIFSRLIKRYNNYIISRSQHHHEKNKPKKKKTKS